jgi:hypothetical protein
VSKRTERGASAAKIRPMKFHVLFRGGPMDGHSTDRTTLPPVIEIPGTSETEKFTVVRYRLAEPPRDGSIAVYELEAKMN